MVDTNSGFGSLAQYMLQDYVKDEVPKAQIMLYSLKNQNYLDKSSTENYEMKRQLEELN